MAARSKEQINGIAASNAAKARLIASHREEFDALTAEERTKLGLSPTPKKSGAMTVDEKIEKLQAQLNELVKQREAA